MSSSNLIPLWFSNSNKLPGESKIRLKIRWLFIFNEHVLARVSGFNVVRLAIFEENSAYLEASSIYRFFNYKVRCSAACCQGLFCARRNATRRVLLFRRLLNSPRHCLILPTSSPFCWIVYAPLKDFKDTFSCFSIPANAGNSAQQ